MKEAYEFHHIALVRYRDDFN
ncbi:hypothetical protein OCEANICA350_12617 [Oceanicaulis sp. 350]|nr:hypothetical protein OCEANICA350_12617 [Oceanicaulis sp. 350]